MPQVPHAKGKRDLALVRFLSQRLVACARLASTEELSETGFLPTLRSNGGGVDFKHLVLSKGEFFAPSRVHRILAAAVQSKGTVARVASRAGDERTYGMTCLLSHTVLVDLVTCAQCAALEQLHVVFFPLGDSLFLCFRVLVSGCVPQPLALLGLDPDSSFYGSLVHVSELAPIADSSKCARGEDVAPRHSWVSPTGRQSLSGAGISLFRNVFLLRNTAHNDSKRIRR